jgi:putative Mg2+ transporter-C (MgtC) family protein
LSLFFCPNYSDEMSNSSTWDFFQLLHYFGPRILVAILCGGIIGLERELKNKAAGIKTNMLICLGSALYTSVSSLMALNISESGHFGDPTRIAAQIVSGIGFLGGGAIIQAKGTVQGLTTAATIWVVAAIGVCIGIGHSDMAILASFSVISVLVLTTTFEDKILGRTHYFGCEIVADDSDGHVRMMINQALSQNDLAVDNFSIHSRGVYSVLNVHYKGHRNDNKDFILGLWSIPGITEVKQH